jgi:YVTN family beta-propeller protein
VTNYISGTVSVVSSGGQLLSTIAIPGSPSNPEGIAFDGHYVWVANDSDANSVTKINASTRTIVATYPVGRAPDAVAFDGRYIWVANSDSATVWLLDPATGNPVAKGGTDWFPTDLLYDGTNMWIANGYPATSGPGTIMRFRATDGGNAAKFTVGLQVRGLGYDGDSIWVCNSFSNTVSRLSTPNVTLMGTFSTGMNPRAAAFDGDKIWISNTGQNTLTIIVPPEFQAKFRAGPNSPQLGSPQVVTQRAPAPSESLSAVFHLLVDDK